MNSAMRKAFLELMPPDERARYLHNESRLFASEWDESDDGFLHRQVNRDDDAYEAVLHIEPVFKNIEGASGDPTPRE